MYFENPRHAEQMCCGFSAYLYEATEGSSPTAAYRCDK